LSTTPIVLDSIVEYLTLSKRLYRKGIGTFPGMILVR
jgi:hypothetical protein